MYSKINLFPNYEDEDGQIVGFTFHVQTEDVPDLDSFELHLDGYIPASDSVNELRERALAKTKAILNELCKK
jgi:hypothetical protein